MKSEYNNCSVHESIMTNSVVFKRFNRYITAILLRYCSFNSMEDVRQDVYLEIFKNLHAIKVPDRIRFWISTVTRRSALKHRKGKGREVVSSTSPHPVKSGFDAVSARLELEKFSKNVHNLTLREKFVLRRICFQGKNSTEVARELGVTPATIRTTLHCARKKLKC